MIAAFIVFLLPPIMFLIFPKFSSFRISHYGFSMSVGRFFSLLPGLLGFAGFFVFYFFYGSDSSRLIFAGYPILLIAYFLVFGTVVAALIPKQDVRNALDFTAPVIFSILLFCRIYCIISECYELKFIPCSAGLTLVPAPQVEVICILIALLLVLLSDKFRFPINAGERIFIFMTLYGILREVLESYYVTENLFAGMSSVQWFSILYVLTGSLILFLLRINARNSRESQKQGRRIC